MRLTIFLSTTVLGLLGPVYAADEATERARDMRNDLGAVLWPTFYEQGPLEALTVCHEKAQDIAAKHSNEGVSMSRISHKPRNPDNAIPEWATEHYEQLRYAFETSEGQTAAVDFKTEQGESVSLRAIGMSNQCLACHGSAIETELHSAIDRLYPNDQAVDFSETSFRGAFLIKWLN